MQETSSKIKINLKKLGSSQLETGRREKEFRNAWEENIIYLSFAVNADSSPLLDWLMK